MASERRHPVVAPALRDLIHAAAHADPFLGRGEVKVLLSVIALTAGWSKLSDTVALSVVAELSGLSQREVGRRLKSLAERGLIDYKPGRGAGHLSTIAINVRGCALLSSEIKARACAHLSDPEKVRGLDEKGARNGQERCAKCKEKVRACAHLTVFTGVTGDHRADENLIPRANTLNPEPPDPEPRTPNPEPRTPNPEPRPLS